MAKNLDIYNSIKQSNCFDQQSDDRAETRTYSDNAKKDIEVNENVKAIKSNSNPTKAGQDTDLSVALNEQQIASSSSKSVQTVNGEQLQKTKNSVSPSDISDLRGELESYRNELVDILDCLTKISNGQIELNISQIKEYQIWRDKSDIALVDTQKKELIAYSEISRDFFPKNVDNYKTKDFKSKNLVKNILAVNPKLKLTHKPDLNNAKELVRYFRSIDPINRKSISKSSSQNIGGNSKSINEVFKIVNQYAKNISLALVNKIKSNVEYSAKQAKSVSCRAYSQYIAEKTSMYFDTAYNKTEEKQYNIGKLLVEKIDKETYKIYDQNQKFLLAYKVDEYKDVKVTSNLTDISKLRDAKANFNFKDIEAIGDKEIFTQYEQKTNILANQLQRCAYGKYKINNDELFLEKTNNLTVLKDKNKNEIVKITQKSKEFNININEIDKVNSIINVDIDKRRQELKIRYVSNILQKYLEFNNTLSVNKENFSINYDPKSKILNYVDKISKDNYITVKLKKNGCQNIDSNIKDDRMQYFKEVNAKMQDFINKKTHNSRSR